MKIHKRIHSKVKAKIKEKNLNPKYFLFLLIPLFIFSSLYFYKNSKSVKYTKIEKNIVDTFSAATTTSTTNEIATTSEVFSQGDELLGSASISFAGGSAGRQKNIEIGVSRINGKVVNPGEIFSFTKAMGVVSKEDGFSDEKVFLNGEVTKGLGGGLCQVSTTLFQSVLNAGLFVTERHNHSFTVSRYEVGLDATYSDPGPDLKFKNNMETPITIVGKTENQKVLFEVYGKSDGRVASTSEPEILSIEDFPPAKYVATTTRSKSEPECINTPQIGYTAKVIHEVYNPKTGTSTQIFISHYKPLQRVCYNVVDSISSSTTTRP